MDRKALADHIAAHPVSGAPQEMRAAFRALTAPAARAAPPGRAVSGEGYSGRLHGHHGGAPVLYMHGGGYVFGGTDTHRGLAHSLMMAARRDVLVLELPLAPERLWPAQENAALRAIEGLAGRHGEKIVVAGDSAGGHLALLMALSSQKVAACAAFSANTMRDYGRSESRPANSGCDLMVDPQGDHALARTAFGSVREDDPQQTLLLQDLSRLPPTYLSVGTDEVLRDDTLVFAHEAARAGAVLNLRTRDGFHMEEVFAPVFGPGLASVQDAGDWIRALS